jgi:predicted Ser/Thr protein kinase
MNNKSTNGSNKIIKPTLGKKIGSGNQGDIYILEGPRPPQKSSRKSINPHTDLSQKSIKKRSRSRSRSRSPKKSKSPRKSPRYLIKIFKYVDPNSKAVKILPKFMQKQMTVEKQKERIHNEIKIQKLASELRIAPKILSYTDDYIIMEYINGSTLDKYLNGDKGHKYETIKKKLQGTIDKMHKYGIKHNDLIGPNIMIDTNGKIYIIDFGMATYNPESQDLEDDQFIL